MRRNAGFSDGFESSHEYGIVKVIATEGCRFLNWKGAKPLLFSDKLYNLLKCDFTWAWTFAPLL